MPVNKATPSLELLRHIIVDASRARNQVQLVDCIVRHVQRVYNVPARLASMPSSGYLSSITAIPWASWSYRIPRHGSSIMRMRRFWSR